MDIYAFWVHIFHLPCIICLGTVMSLLQFHPSYSYLLMSYISRYQVLIEAVENHMPQVIIIDEISTKLEAMAASTIAQRGIQLVATAHGVTIENLIMNPLLEMLVGGIQVICSYLTAFFFNYSSTVSNGYFNKCLRIDCCTRYFSPLLLVVECTSLYLVDFSNCVNGGSLLLNLHV